MDVTVSVEGSNVRVSPVGELDAHNCGEVGDALRSAAEGTSAANAVIDASGLSFIDSSAISELLRLREELADDGGSLVMIEVQPSVRRVLEITGLLETFGVS
jgi:anti-sigma B factor antagonist